MKKVAIDPLFSDSVSRDDLEFIQVNNERNKQLKNQLYVVKSILNFYKEEVK